MFELKDLPDYDTVIHFAQQYKNSDTKGLYTWLIWASASEGMLAGFDANLAQYELSQTQFFVLLLLKRNIDGMSIGRLASGVSVTSQTMTRTIDRMERSGLCSAKAHLKAWYGA